MKSTLFSVIQRAHQANPKLKAHEVHSLLEKNGVRANPNTVSNYLSVARRQGVPLTFTTDDLSYLKTLNNKESIHVFLTKAEDLVKRFGSLANAREAARALGL
jgi:Fe2+ or Zn2+ uptake regulation protein